VRQAFRKADIFDIRPHDFRHTFGSRALRADPNLKKLKEAMDHSSIASTVDERAGALCAFAPA
jgi:integrase